MASPLCSPLYSQFEIIFSLNCVFLVGGENSGRGQKRLRSPCRSPPGRNCQDISRSPSSSPERSAAASDAEDRNPSDADSISSEDSSSSKPRSSWKYVAEGSWVKTQWLSARCLSDKASDASADGQGPSKDLAFGKLSSEWNRISTNRLRRKWAHSVGAPSFAPPKSDDSLAAAFENVKTKSKAAFSILDSTLHCTGAAAHAVLSAKAFVQCFMNELPKTPPSKEEWSQWRHSTKESFKSSVLSPITDATTCLASVTNGCVKDVRRLVLATPQARQLKSALKDSKPSSTHYFGNETDKVNSAISSAYMLKSLDDKSSSRRFTPYTKKAGGSFSSRPQGYRPSYQNKSTKPFRKPSATRGNSSSRPARGKGAGRE